MPITRPALGSVAAVCLCAAGCLVSDSRPTPGSVLVTASSDETLRAGVTTADGWTVRYDRFTASLGHASPEGDECTFYSDTAYNRVLDMRLADAQKLGIIYALGKCELDFEVSSPAADSVLGVGIAPADRDFMRTPASDDVVAGGGISIFVEGKAESEGTEKHFAWAFRNRIDYTNCFARVDGKVVHGVELASEKEEHRDFTVHGGTLFQDRLEAAQAALAFAPFAAADDAHGDADGEVTLTELGRVALAEIANEGRYLDADAGWTTLEDYVYRGLFTKIVRYQGDGACEEIEVFPNDRVPH